MTLLSRRWTTTAASQRDLTKSSLFDGIFMRVDWYNKIIVVITSQRQWDVGLSRVLIMQHNGSMQAIWKTRMRGHTRFSNFQCYLKWFCFPWSVKQGTVTMLRGNTNRNEFVEPNSLCWGLKIHTTSISKDFHFQIALVWSQRLNGY